MSLKGQALRDLVMERLVVAADEIFALFERTIAEYEEEALRPKLLQEPGVERPRADVQTLPVRPDVGPSPNLVEEEQMLCVKQEQQEPPLEFPFSPFSVKTEDHVDKSSLLQQKTAEEDREDTVGEQCEGEEPGCSLDLPSDNNEQTYSCSDTDDSEDWEPSAKRSTKRNGHGSNSVHRKNSQKKNKGCNNNEFDDGERKRKHKCCECGEAFQSKAHLQKHVCVYTGQSAKHLNILTEKKSFRCSVCKKCFRQKCTLIRHMKTHTEEKPFSCPECGLRVKQRHSLYRHISTVHRGEKPYRCPVCEKAFAQKGYFVIHLRTHTGEKPFICTVCNRSFGAKCSLKRHMRTHRTHAVVQEVVQT